MPVLPSNCTSQLAAGGCLRRLPSTGGLCSSSRRAKLSIPVVNADAAREHHGAWLMALVMVMVMMVIVVVMVMVM
eukprot:11212759-Lingulodinium_polyedra.AAC.1